MKWSFATIGIIMLGIIGVAIILLFQTVTTNNENDYYLLKEVTEAAMIDAIDIPHYRETGDLKIVKEKFVENFTRRFAESTIFVASEYTIKHYDIIETPPKVSVVIDTGVGEFTIGGNTDDYGVQNKLDAILEYVGENTGNPDHNPYVSKTYTEYYYAMPTLTGSTFNIRYSMKTPSELIAPNIKNIKIEDVQIVSETINQEILGMALLQNNLSYNNHNISNDNYMQSKSSYATILIINEYSEYNCQSGSNADYECDNTNKYYITFRGSANETGKTKAIFKYKVTWSYNEYEFSD